MRTRSQHVVHAFCADPSGIAPPLAGNPCHLIIEAAEPAPYRELPRAATLCLSWPLQKDHSRAAVRCYGPSGQPIACCGHGLLAAAHYWLAEGMHAAVLLDMGGQSVSAHREGDMLWLRFARIHCIRQSTPPWLGQLLPNTTPVAVAVACAGGADGYRVVELEPGTPLSSLPAPGGSLAEYTGRALIYTAERAPVDPVDIQLRYFAPQYGVAEDTATGSAMRILADYWSPRFRTLRAEQCSSKGGYLMSRIADDYVEVGGFCRDAQGETGIDQRRTD